MEIVNEGDSNQAKNADINDKESNFNELITLIILIYIYTYSYNYNKFKNCTKKYSPNNNII